MANFLPVAAPSWPSLRDLILRDMDFSEFPARLAGVLGSLSYLDLAGNEFATLPPALKLLSNLRQLELPRNAPLQLKARDADTLAALPHLHTINVSKSCGDIDAEADVPWVESSVIALIAITKRLPFLKLAYLAEG